MSFYGDIKNTARAQFYFDRIYPNRLAMDTNAKKDGIYASRYVLVEYEQDISEDDFANYYYYGGDMYTQMNTVTVKMALDPTKKIEAFDGPILDSMVQNVHVKNGDICCVRAGNHIQASKRDTYIRFTSSRGGFTSATPDDYKTFYERHSDMQDPGVYIINGAVYTERSFISGQLAKIEKQRDYITFSQSRYWRANLDNDGTLTWDATSTGDNVFERNFNIDKAEYGLGRTYDSTVWQKVYVGNQEKYIMIADLNTIVPTFTFTADAPTVTPVPIHYDPNNTNTNYNIHMQGPWGFRIHSAKSDLKLPIVDHNGKISDKEGQIFASEDNRKYPTDAVTTWKGSFYDIKTEEEKERYFSQHSGKWNGIKDNSSSVMDAAIYFNKKGFSPTTICKSVDIKNKLSEIYDPVIAKWMGKDIEDEIIIAPTGYSGRVYNDHLNNEGHLPQKDTQELVMMLPTIGNTISDVWDLVYGGRNTNSEIQATSKRNLDISWEYANKVVKKNGLRAVQDDNGRFSTQQVETLAGALNSVHDLMGMILVDNPDDTIDLTKLEDGVIIQYQDGTYRRKYLDYNYTAIPQNWYNYNVIELDSANYAPGEYYIKNGSTYVRCDDATVSESKVYYQKVLNGNVPGKYSVVSVENKPTQTLYYEVPGGASGKPEYRVVPTPAEDITYKTLESANPIKVTAYYEPYKFYYAKDANVTGYVLDKNTSATLNRAYLTIDEEKKPPRVINFSLKDINAYDKNSEKYVVSRDDYGNITESRDLVYMYHPGGYFYKKTINSDGSETLSLETRPQNQINLNDDYYIVNGDEVQGEGGTWVKDPDGNWTTSSEASNLRITGMYKVKLINFQPKTFFTRSKKALIPNEDIDLKYDDDDKENSETPSQQDNLEQNEDLENNPLLETYVEEYTYLTEDSLKEIYDKEFTFNVNTAVFTDIYSVSFDDAGTFYSPNTFYYQTSDGSFVVDDEEEMTKLRQYYDSVSFGNKTNVKFYLPNKYYYLDSVTNNYVIDRNLTKAENRTYYKLNGGLYVISDSKEEIAKYSEWSKVVKTVPASVELGTRTENLTSKTLDGFARSLNTIHGLILKVNEILEIDNYKTRDRRTVQGCINLVNDIINKFDELQPGNFAIIDDYGRVNSSHWTTKQKESSVLTKPVGASELTLAESTVQDKFVEVDSVSAMRGQWLTVGMNADPNAPKISVHHNFQKVKDTTSTSNKNSDNVASSNNSDKISLYTPIVDEMGHVVGKNTETVTLPYGFKTIASNGESSAVTQLTTSHANVIAENTQDTFTINVGNKWIRTATNASTDTMTFAHALSPISSQANTKYGLQQDETIQLLDADNTFEVPVFKFDEAGHIIFAETHTVTIPEVFENVKIVGSSTNTDDTTSADGTTGTVSADTLQDTLNFAAGNKWIQMSHNEGSDTITFKHFVKKFSEGAASTDLDESNTFTVQELVWDNAGHLTGSTKRTYTLQDGFKTLTIANSGATTTTSPSGSTGNLVAATQVDTAKIDTANRWITLVTDTTNKKVSIAHAAAGTASVTKGQADAASPKFGETFKVLRAGFDQTGHMKDLEEKVITLPTVALTNATSGNVVTGISLDASTRNIKFTETKANVGTLSLAEYVAPSANSTEALANSDTINGAFKKVQAHLSHLDTTIDNLDLSAKGSTNGSHYISYVKQENGQLSATAQQILTAMPNNGATDTSLISTKAIKTYVDGKITDLSYGGSTDTTKKFVSNVTETDGIISVTTRAIVADDIPNLNANKITAGTFNADRIPSLDATKITTGQFNKDRIPDLSATYLKVDKTFTYEKDASATPEDVITEMNVEQLVARVAYLEERIAALENPTA